MFACERERAADRAGERQLSEDRIPPPTNLQHSDEGRGGGGGGQQHLLTLVVKPLEHSGHTNGLSPVCVRR